MLIQIYNKILLKRENYADAANVIVDFVNYNNRLQASLGKDMFLIIFKDIFNISKMVKD